LPWKPVSERRLTVNNDVIQIRHIGASAQCEYVWHKQLKIIKRIENPYANKRMEIKNDEL
jgi:hypothetical protein